MTREQIYTILHEERSRQRKVCNNNNLIASLKCKLSISSASSGSERVQTSVSKEPGFVEVTNLICDLEIENAKIIMSNIEYIKILANTKLDDVERLMIEYYFGSAMSYRKTAIKLYREESLLYDHKRVKKVIEYAIDKIATNGRPKNPTIS